MVGFEQDETDPFRKGITVRRILESMVGFEQDETDPFRKGITVRRILESILHKLIDFT